MGTRADFWTGRESADQWLGSVAMDGYPEGVSDKVLLARSEDAFRAAVEEFLAERRDATTPDLGWPWPWGDSCLTDYAYVFNGDGVDTYSYGRFVPPGESEDDERMPKESFPDMTERKRVTYGSRSGLIVINGP